MVDKAVAYFFDHRHSAHEAGWLRRLLYCYVLMKCGYWLADFDALFGEASIVARPHASVSFIRSFAFLFFNSGSDAVACIVLVLAGLGSLFGLLFVHWSRLIAFTVWMLVVNINNAVYPTLTGGDFLLQQLLFFNIFFSARSGGGDLSRAFHNAGVAAVKIQVCVVYFIAGLAKLMNADWLNGTALAQTLMIHDFSVPALYNGAAHPVLLAIMGYAVVAYQLLFPVLIWIRPLKQWLIVFGIMQHLFIAFVMGLPSFGFILIIAYSIFYAPGTRLRNS